MTKQSAVDRLNTTKTRRARKPKLQHNMSEAEMAEQKKHMESIISSGTPDVAKEGDDMVKQRADELEASVRTEDEVIVSVEKSSGTGVNIPFAGTNRDTEWCGMYPDAKVAHTTETASKVPGLGTVPEQETFKIPSGNYPNRTPQWAIDDFAGDDMNALPASYVNRTPELRRSVLHDLRYVSPPNPDEVVSTKEGPVGLGTSATLMGGVVRRSVDQGRHYRDHLKRFSEEANLSQNDPDNNFELVVDAINTVAWYIPESATTSVTELANPFYKRWQEDVNCGKVRLPGGNIRLWRIVVGICRRIVMSPSTASSLLEAALWLFEVIDQRTTLFKDYRVSLGSPAMKSSAAQRVYDVIERSLDYTMIPNSTASVLVHGHKTYGDLYRWAIAEDFKSVALKLFTDKSLSSIPATDAEVLMRAQGIVYDYARSLCALTITPKANHDNIKQDDLYRHRLVVELADILSGNYLEQGYFKMRIIGQYLEDLEDCGLKSDMTPADRERTITAILEDRVLSMGRELHQKDQTIRSLSDELHKHDAEPLPKTAF